MHRVTVLSLLLGDGYTTKYGLPLRWLGPGLALPIYKTDFNFN